VNLKINPIELNLNKRNMKTINKIRLLLAKIAKYFFATVFSLGFLGTVAAIILIIYEVSINTHRGFLEIVSAILLLGGIGFFRLQAVVKKLNYQLIIN